MTLNRLPEVTGRGLSALTAQRALRALTVLCAWVVLTSGVAKAAGQPDRVAPDRVTPDRVTPDRVASKLDKATETRLSRLFSGGDTARVIVQLASAAEPDARLRTGPRPKNSRLKRRREAVDRLQQRLLATTPRPRGVKRLRNSPILAMEIDRQGLERLLAHPDVAVVREDVLMRPDLEQSVPRIGGDVLWRSGYTGLGQTVAVLDSGADGTHPALAGKVVAEACFSTTNSVATSLCPGGGEEELESGAGAPCQGISGCDHGTHVAGIAVANDGNMRGVAPDASLIPIQVFSRFDDNNSCGGSAPCILTYFSDVLRALDWLFDQRGRYAIASANLSLGSGRYTASCDDAYGALTTVIGQLYSAGTATVISSGNAGYRDSLGLPACIARAVSVGATTANDGVANFSNSSSELDLLAPGTGIVSSLPGGGFGGKNGTSMAAPHVAGSFALLRSAVPSATVAESLAAMVTSGLPVTDTRNGLVVARIQLDQALATMTGTPLPDAPPPALRLLPGQLDRGRYGYGYGSGEHESELAIVFDGHDGDLRFSVTGYDIERSNEISVFLNGVLLGRLSMGPSGANNRGDHFKIPASMQSSGENRLLLTQRVPGNTWGVTDLLLARAWVSDVVESNDIRLTLAATDRSLYGNGLGSNLHPTELGARFESVGAGLALRVTGHDIDLDDEVRVLLNGQPLGWLSRGTPGGTNRGDQFNIPVSWQLTGTNRVTFAQQNADWVWGVSDLSLTATGAIPTPDVQAPDHPVVVSVGDPENGRYGYDYGSSLHRTELSVVFQSDGSSLVLYARGFDIDNNADVAVYLNGALIGHMSPSPANALSPVRDGFSLPAGQQLTGENIVVFRQLRAGRKWGITELLLSR